MCIVGLFFGGVTSTVNVSKLKTKRSGGSRRSFVKKMEAI